MSGKRHNSEPQTSNHQEKSVLLIDHLGNDPTTPITSITGSGDFSLVCEGPSALFLTIDGHRFTIGPKRATRGRPFHIHVTEVASPAPPVGT